MTAERKRGLLRNGEAEVRYLGSPSKLNPDNFRRTDAGDDHAGDDRDVRTLSRICNAIGCLAHSV